MTRKYTAADFANAKFAEHPDGDIAIKWGDNDAGLWETENLAADDAEMARDGWVPAPTKPTITESVVKAETANMNAGDKAIFGLALYVAGVEVIPDPEPTNTDNLAKLLGDVATDAGVNLNPRLFAEQLDKAGVTAPNVKGN